jgi:GumC protein
LIGRGSHQAESERMTKEALYRQTKDKDFDALPSILENKLIADLKQAYIQLEAQYMKLSETYKPEYPEMVRIKNQMETIQKRMDAETNKVIAGIRVDYEASLRKESLIRQAFQQQKARVVVMKDQGIQYNILKREVETNKQLRAIELFRKRIQKVLEQLLDWE